MSEPGYRSRLRLLRRAGRRERTRVRRDRSLTREQIGQIVEIQRRGLRQRLAGRHLSLELTDAAKDLLANQGYDPVYGARPLKRAIQRRILDPLAQAVLRGEFREGKTLVVDSADGQIVFRHGAPEQREAAPASVGAPS